MDVWDYLERARREEAKALIADIARWEEARLIHELGDNAQAQKNLDLVDRCGLRAEFVAALATHHGKTLADWLPSNDGKKLTGGKKLRAAKNFAAWKAR